MKKESKGDGEDDEETTVADGVAGEEFFDGGEEDEKLLESMSPEIRQVNSIR